MAQAITSLRIAHDGFLKVLVAEVSTASGETVTREIIERGNAVAVLPYDRERRTALLVRLPRIPVLQAIGRAELLEAIAGVIEHEAPDETARREALEEAGVRLEALEPVGLPFVSPGFTTERIGLYLAPYAAGDRIEAGGGVAGEHEDIEVVEIALAELAALADRHEIEDMKTLALVQTLRLKHPDLFGA